MIAGFGLGCAVLKRICEQIVAADVGSDSALDYTDHGAGIHIRRGMILLGNHQETTATQSRFSLFWIISIRRKERYLG